MIKQDERISIEKKLIRSFFENKYLFQQTIDLKADSNLFVISEHKEIYNSLVEYYQEKGRFPRFTDFAEYLSSQDNKSEITKYLLDEIYKVNYRNLLLATKEPVKLLLEDNIEKEIRDKISKVDSTGIEYASQVTELISNTITDFESRYKREETNESRLERVLANIKKAMNGDYNSYIRTGFYSIDSKIIGIPKGHLTTIAARPGMGKSAFILQLLRNLKKQKTRVGIFSLEMEAESLDIRNLSEATGIDSIKIESGDLTEQEFTKIKTASLQYSSNDYIIDADPYQTPQKIKAKINLWRMNKAVDVIAIDYLTLIHTKYQKERNDLEVGALSNDLRIFAKETEIPIIILSQLNRQVESRPDKRPMLSDLRESGAIEQDSKLVLFLHRPAYYGIDPFKNSEYEFFTKDNTRLKADEYNEVIISKCRNGRTGRVPFRYQKEVHRFEEVIAKECISDTRLSKMYEEKEAEEIF